MGMTLWEWSVPEEGGDAPTLSAGDTRDTFVLTWPTGETALLEWTGTRDPNGMDRYRMLEPHTPDHATQRGDYDG